MILQPLDQIEFSDLHALCQDCCPESERLEFKRGLPGNSDKDKHELCKDVAALANSDGGDLVYGIEEKDGCAGLLVPITGELADAALRRLSQILDASIEPRIRGVKMRPVNMEGGYAVVLRIPASFDGPHSIRTNNNRRFVMRNGTGITDMSYDQLRAAFDRTATLAELARRFIADRIELIVNKKTSMQLYAGPQWVIHLVPVAGLSGRQVVDLKNVYSKTYGEFIGNNWTTVNRKFNFDGLILHPSNSQDDAHYTYHHIFRNGALEGVSLGGETREMTQDIEKSIVWSVDMSKFFYHSIKLFLTSIKKLGFSGPAVLSVAMLNVQGYELGIDQFYYQRRHSSADRPHLIPPDVWIEDIDIVDIDSTIRTLLDMMWQGFGRESCMDFNSETGVFSPRN